MRNVSDYPIAYRISRDYIIIIFLFGKNKTYETNKKGSEHEEKVIKSNDSIHFFLFLFCAMRSRGLSPPYNILEQCPIDNSMDN